MGLQIGLSGRYPITKNLKIRGGFQFNINRYDIKAYAFNGEVATIDLNGGMETAPYLPGQIIAILMAINPTG